jgi:thiol:disulfide interchange protein
MYRALFFLAACFTWLLPCADAQEMKASSKLFAREKGDEIQIAIEVTVQPTWHLYHGPADADVGSEGAIGKPTVVEFTAPGFEIGALVYPEPKRVPQDIGDLKYTAYEHVGTFALYARGKKTKPDAKLEDLSATIDGLTCVDSGVCIPYSEDLPLKGAGPDELFAKMPAPAASAPANAPAQAGANAPPATGASGSELKASSKLFAREKDGAVDVAIEVTVQPTWHLYHGPTESDKGSKDAPGKPTTVEFDAEGFELGALEYPKPFETSETIGENKYTVYEHKGTFVLRAHGKRTKPDAKLDAIGATIDGLTCVDNGVCIPYEEELKYAGAGADSLYTAAVQPAGATPRAAAPQKEEEFSLWLFLLSAVGWGLFTLLMPCTYPMIPITISYFTKQAAKSQGSTLPLSLAYGVGIIGTFVLIGVVVGPPIIEFASHWITNLVIGALFLYFSLTLFGAINLQPPAFLLGVAGKASTRGGVAGVFLMGATLVVTSFTCTAPFVGTLLSTGAATGGLGRVALGMAVFGATMAVPFAALSMLPGKAKTIPRAGEWMHTLKVTLGFIEIAAAMKFISNVDLVLGWGWLSRELFLAIWVAVFGAAALYLFGMIKLKDESTTEIAPGRMVAGLVFLVLALYCGYGALGNRMDRIMTAIIPPYSNSLLVGKAGGAAKPAWTIVADDFEGALERARGEGKQVLVNFTGHT